MHFNVLGLDEAELFPDMPKEAEEAMAAITELIGAVYCAGAAKYGDMAQLQAEGLFDEERTPTEKMGMRIEGLVQRSFDLALPYMVTLVLEADKALRQDGKTILDTFHFKD